MFPIIFLALALCAWQALHARSLLHAVLWLAGASALTALLLGVVGATVVAVFELSIGAGLLTVLLVFAISLAGAEAPAAGTRVPPWLAGLLVGLTLLLLFNLMRPWLMTVGSGPEIALAQTLWGTRALEVLLQWVMLLTTALTVLGLMAQPQTQTAAQEQNA